MTYASPLFIARTSPARLNSPGNAAGFTYFSLGDTMIEKVFMCRPLYGLSKSSTLSWSFIFWRHHLLHFSSSESSHLQSQLRNQEQGCSSSRYFTGSPARVQKLIASQSDPLLAKEIFDFASRQPDFHLSYASFQILILKLARAKQFTLVDDVMIRLRSSSYSISPSLFLNLLKIYADADVPDKALKTFYTMLKFNCKPSPKHLNLILEALVSHRHSISPAFDLFKNAHRHGVLPNTKSYNILMRAFCLNGDLSIAYSLFNLMFKRDLLPDVESYRILMQGLCRKSQVSTAVDLLEDMLNKGFIPDALSYTTLLNALCRKKKLREAYKLLCRMKVKGCNPDIVHYNTVILGFCREGRAADACKVLEDMPSNGCMPNLVSYRTLIGGLCDQGMYDEAKTYVEEMVSKGFSLHVSVSHGLIKGFCNVGKIEEACGVVELLLKNRQVLHGDTWLIIVDMIYEENDKVRTQNALQDIMKMEITRHTKIVDAAAFLEGYVIGKIQAKSRRE